MMRWAKALAALGVLAGLIAGIPYGLVRAVGNPWPAGGIDLAAPLTDDVIIGLLATIVWVLWAQLMVCIAVEVVAATRERGADITVPGVLGVQQQLARALVGAVVVALTSLPILGAGVASATTVHETTAAQTVRAPAAAVVEHQGASTTAAPVQTEQHQDQRQDQDRAERTVTVHRGDTLWSLAEEHLDDGQRWREIAAANDGQQMVDGSTFRSADLLRPGWELKLPDAPSSAPATGGDRVTVQAGDTLSQIALEELGDSGAYPAIFEASQDIVQPEGARLVDPDHIEPGWKLQVAPTAAAEREHADPTHGVQEEKDRDRAQPVAPAPAGGDTASERSAEPAAEPTAEPSHAEEATSSPATDQEAGVPGWVLPSLAMGGGVLASALLAALTVRRVGRWRARRPGWVPAVSPAPARSAEAGIEVGAAAAVVDVDELDQVLRRLSATLYGSGRPLPVLAAVEVTDAEIALHLREPAEAPPGWARSEDDRVWFLDRPVDLDQVGPDVSDRPAPWPLLAALGSDNDGTWLMNLEGLAVVIDGDQARSRDLARYVVAELATNPWSRDASIDVVGLEPHLVRLNRARVTHRGGIEAARHVAREAAARSLGRLGETMDTHTARHVNSDPDTWPAHILVVDGLVSSAALDELGHLISHNGARTGASLLFSNSDAPNTKTLALDVDSAGSLRIDAADLRLAAVQLTEEEADAFGQLLEHIDAGEEARPADLAGSNGWEEFATTTGTLREEYRSARVAAPETSLLPAANKTYEAATAATMTDLEELAPAVTPEVSNTVLAADPDLDADLAEWFADVTSRPRLTLLGPVWLRASGEPLAKRRPYYTELAAYLISREHGATTDEVAAAFDISPDRARADVNVLRKWLGTGPDGQKYLPDARSAPAAEKRGVGVYQVVGALTDLDLLRRLRVRAEARGPAGLEDLETALELVTDRPCSQLRAGGWGWLFEGDRTDQHAVVAIADMAHVLVTARLEQGDVAAARAAVERALIAAPEDDITRLNLAAVLEAEGHTAAAAQFVQDQVCNRVDDAEPPAELPGRTVELIERRAWDRRRAV